MNERSPDEKREEPESKQISSKEAENDQAGPSKVEPVVICIPTSPLKHDEQSICVWHSKMHSLEDVSCKMYNTWLKRYSDNRTFVVAAELKIKDELQVLALDQALKIAVENQLKVLIHIPTVNLVGDHTWMACKKAIGDGVPASIADYYSLSQSQQTFIEAKYQRLKQSTINFLVRATNSQVPVPLYIGS